jgi:3-keto steroid reductase
MKATTVPRPILIVTGANGCVYVIVKSNKTLYLDRGVGYGICQRLLLQLCQATPSDSRPQAFASEITSNEPTKCTRFDGVTLIMACRNMKRADAARRKLLQWFDDELGRIPRNQEDEAYVRLFRGGCDVQIAELDLANFSSVLKFAASMTRLYVT